MTGRRSFGPLLLLAGLWLLPRTLALEDAEVFRYLFQVLPFDFVQQIARLALDLVEKLASVSCAI